MTKSLECTTGSGHSQPYREYCLSSLWLRNLLAALCIQERSESIDINCDSYQLYPFLSINVINFFEIASEQVFWFAF